MPVQSSDIKFRKSLNVTNGDTNGGRKGYVEVVSGVRHNLFPRISKHERLNGVEKYRKEFWCNENPDDEIAYDVDLYLEYPSTAEDHFALMEGSQTDTQSDLVTDIPPMLGVGKLDEALLSGAVSLKVLMPTDEFQFINGGRVHITDKFLTGQTMAGTINIGDSIQYDGTYDEWYKIQSTDDINYPKGLYLGDNIVMTKQDTSNEEWLQTKENLYTDEDIGNGDDTTSPTLSSLSNNINGICNQPNKQPVVTATSGGNPLTVNIDKDGNCSGDCTSGKLNMSDGTWDTNIVWTGTIDTGTDILITYRENCFSYSGSQATVELEDQVANAYSETNSYVGACLSAGDVVANSIDWNEVSGSGTYDETSYPVVLFNDGTVEDIITITFTSSTTFTATGAYEGTLGTGSISADFAPINPNTGNAYFKIDRLGWGGSWQSGDTITFKTHPSAFPIWLKEVVPAGTNQADNNLLVLGSYNE